MERLSSAEITQHKKTVLDSLARLEGKKILVVGDVGLDEYLAGDVRRISPEAPVPVVEVQSREFRVGLAANVAQNVHSLGGVGLMVGVVGNDASAKDLSALLKSNGVSEQNLVVDADRPTTRKVRVMSGQHHVVRVDFEERRFLPSVVEKNLFDKFAALLPSCEGVVLQDYGKGVLSETICQKLISLTHGKKKRVVVDPHRTTPVRYYRGADLIKPNRDEAFILSGLNLDDLRQNADSVVEVARAIQEQTNTTHLIVTQGKDGVVIFSGAEPSRGQIVPTEPRQVFDVTGAGDTYLAAFALAWFSGLDLVTAAVMANAAAGVVVGKIGCVPCSQAELVDALNS
jgi:rfaE bifunctional protein kinase chain/domain